ncbi:hypothetical protein B0H17DRAFT_1169692 [Mycena rosella]|uniref:NAD(P)-binding protein n=1 Tax=Mycena rosella TaxID=1033263 RepID=A0AAD7GFT3_MYCRO|nr:hypothetical protein B0H17DRAFT_1169692 [Mycena rosella]
MDPQLPIDNFTLAFSERNMTSRFQVFATARRPESMQDLFARGIATLTFEVTDADVICTIRDEIAAKTGGTLDILVNNAFVAYPVAITDFEMDRVREIFEVHLFAPMVMVKEFAQLLIAAGDVRIVHIGSVSGIMPIPFSAVYNTSKLRCITHLNIFQIMSGGVQSKIARSGSLPDDSLFKGMEDLYQAKRLNISQDAYARIVVAESVKAAPRAWVWVGRNAFLDYLMSKKFGISEFSARLANGKVKID